MLLIDRVQAGSRHVSFSAFVGILLTQLWPLEVADCW